MIRIALAAVLLPLAACSDGEAEPASPAEIRAAAGEHKAVVPKPAATAQQLEQDNDLLEFSYRWPAEAAAIAKLNGRFSADAAERLAEAGAFAREDMQGRSADIPFHGHYFKQDWVVAGDAERLLSLGAEVATFTGGAHGNAVYTTVLWDRAANAEIEVADLFVDPARAMAAMAPAYCGELNRQRAEKRGGGEGYEGSDWMTECRPIAETEMAPFDVDHDGRFDVVRVLIAPYEAGPYAEGSYEVDVPITPALRAMVKPEFGGSF